YGVEGRSPRAGERERAGGGPLTDQAGSRVPLEIPTQQLAQQLLRALAAPERARGPGAHAGGRAARQQHQRAAEGQQGQPAKGHAPRVEQILDAGYGQAHRLLDRRHGRHGRGRRGGGRGGGDGRGGQRADEVEV